jgi:hypothetical protein
MQVKLLQYFITTQYRNVAYIGADNAERSLPAISNKDVAISWHKICLPQKLQCARKCRIDYL